MVMYELAAVRDAGTSDDDVARKVRRAGLTVAIVVTIGSGAATVLDPRLGLFASAVILGWTQLVGL